MPEVIKEASTKKEVNGDLYFLRLAGLNSELSVKSADSPESLIGSFPPSLRLGGNKNDWRRN